MMTESTFVAVVARYRAIFLDHYGVLRNGRGWLPGAAEALRWLEQHHCPAWVITNDSSIPPSVAASRFLHPDFGALVPQDRIVSAAHGATRFLRARPEVRSVVTMGPPGSEWYLEQAHVSVERLTERTRPEACDAFCLMDDAGFDWERDLNHAVNLILDRPDAPLLCPNQDTSFIVEGRRSGIAPGAIARMIEAVVGRRFLHFGKPLPAIFESALELARREIPDLEAGQVLMVGDTLATDIAGGIAAGVETLLVLSGNTPPDRWQEAVAAAGVVPTHVAPAVVCGGDYSRSQEAGGVL